MTKATKKTTVGLKLASYNLFNLGRQDNPGTEAYRAKLGFLAEVLRRIAPDVAVVQEVREPESLEELAHVWGWPVPFIADAPEEHRRIRVGILSRLPVIDNGQWHDFPAVLPDRSSEVMSLVFRRPVPWVRVELPNRETLLVVGVHLKSRRADLEMVSEDESVRRRTVLGQALSAVGRIREAAGLRCLLDREIEQGTADHYTVMGDFNDGPDSDAAKLVMGIDAAGSDEEKAEGGCELFPVARLIPRERAFSYVGWRKRELLDHILVSRNLSLGLRSAGAENQLLESFVRQRAREMPVGYPCSDHAPVWAAFDLPTDVR